MPHDAPGIKTSEEIAVSLTRAGDEDLPEVVRMYEEIIARRVESVERDQAEIGRLQDHVAESLEVIRRIGEAAEIAKTQADY